MGLWNSKSDSDEEDEAVITEDELDKAVRRCGYDAPSSEVYRWIARETEDFTREEMAMFLAQMIHESGGFEYQEEQDPPSRYDSDGYGEPGRSYHGRGYIQLTWSENYRNASRALGLGDDLVRNPSKVAKSVKLSVKVSVWYWKRFVRPEYRKRKNCFGVTTKAINGAIECSGGYNEAAHERYKKYKKVCKVMGIDNVASERGCYN